MSPLLRRFLRVVAYGGAALIILLAVAVGLFRLLLPQLPEYRTEIQQRVSAAVGVDVSFERMDARWRFSGPELLFENIVLSEPGDGATLLEADEAIVVVAVAPLLLERRIQVRRVVVSSFALFVERDADGRLLLEGRAIDEWTVPRRPRDRAEEQSDAANVVVRFENLDVYYRDPAARREQSMFPIDWAEYRQTDDGRSIRFTVGSIDGAPLQVAADRRELDDQSVWSVFVESDDIELARYALALPASVAVPLAGSGPVDIWMDWRDGALTQANANLDLSGLSVPLGPDADEFARGSVAGGIEWSRRDGTVVAAFDLSRIVIDGTAWRATRGQLDASFDGDGVLSELRLDAGYLDLGELARFRRWLPANFSAPLGELRPVGSLLSVDLTLRPLDAGGYDYRLAAEFDDLGAEPWDGWPGVTGLTGELNAESGSGRLLLDMGPFRIDAPDWFAGPLIFDYARGGVTWRDGSRGLAILSDSLEVASVAFATTTDFELLVPGDDASPVIDLDMAFSVAALESVPQYLPAKRMGPALVRWFNDALIAGRIDSGTLALAGPLDAFPFRAGDGRFAVRADVRDAVLRFAGTWPDVAIESADVRMDGLRLYTDTNVGSTLGIVARNARVEMPDVTAGQLSVESSAETAMPAALEYVRSSPIADLLGPRIGDVTGAGDVAVRLDLDYPIRDRDAFSVELDIEPRDATLGLVNLPQQLTALTGRATVRRDSIDSEALSGVLLGSEAAIELLPSAADSGYRAQAIVSGELDGERLRREIASPLLGAVDGTAPYRATVRFPGRDPDKPVALSIRVETDLDGMAVGLPAPMTKAAAVAEPTQLNVRFPGDDTIEIGGRYGDRARWLIIFNKDDDGWAITRGNVRAGAAQPVLPVGRGLFVDGAVPSVRIGDWLDYVASLNLPPRDEPLLRGMDLRADEAFGYGQRVEQIALKLDRNPSDWLIQLDSERVAGAIFVPLDLDSGREIVLQMERLRLVEADPEAGESGDPRNLPPLSIRADDFQLGERRFGSLEVDVTRSANGVVADTFVTRHPSFTAAGGGAWEIDAGGDERTRLTAALTSSNVAGTSEALSIDSGIEADRASAGVDVSWQGPPRSDFFDALDGEFSILIESGKLDDVDPGAGRVLGLMSVLELPRRLALDFRDVFGKGLSFNRITGDYRIVNGEAFTCNLSLEAPAADIALIGRAGLSRRDYNQTAVVSANVGNSLPAVGAVVGGPQVAAAMLVLSRIFKKPLQEVGQTYYQITGSWDEPSIERTDIERFYATSQLADCLQSVE